MAAALAGATARGGLRMTNDNPDDPIRRDLDAPVDYWYALRWDTDLKKDQAASGRSRPGLPAVSKTADSHGCWPRERLRSSLE